MTEATANELDERVLGRRWTVRLDAPQGVAARPYASRATAPRAPSSACRVHGGGPCGRGRAPQGPPEGGAAPPVPTRTARAGPTAAARTSAPTSGRAGGSLAVRRSGRPGRRRRPGGPLVAGAGVLFPLCGRHARGEGRRHGAARAAGRPPPRRPAAAPTGTPGSPTAPPPRRCAGRAGPPLRARAAPPPQKKIAQRVIPHDLHPTSLRDELVELGDLFRAYQQRPEPDLALLADLHERRPAPSAAGPTSPATALLRWEARRAEQAAAAIRLQHLQRTGGVPAGDGPAVARLLTAPAQWEHARSVLAYAADHSPLPGRRPGCWC